MRAAMPAERMSQSHRHSMFEAVANVVIGYAIMVAAQCVIFPCFDIHVEFRTNLKIGLSFLLVSLARSYALRRIFNNWQ